MELLWKGILLGLISCILGIILGKHAKEQAILLSIAGSSAIVIVAVCYLEPVIEFLRELETLASLHASYLAVIIKACGVGLASEIAANICNDAGNQSLGKGIHILGSAVILWLSVPVYTALLELIGIFLEEI